jgi:hypothetical protein
MILFVVSIWIAQTVLSQVSDVEIVPNINNFLVVRPDIDQYAKEAKIIVIGTVNEVSDPYFNGGITVLQDATLRIEEVLKGNISLKEIQVGGIGQQIEISMEEQSNIGKLQNSLKGKEGMLKLGERVLLFLVENPDAEYIIYGLYEGKYLIDDKENINGVNGFKMSMKKFKKEIKDSLEIEVSNDH